MTQRNGSSRRRGAKGAYKDDDDSGSEGGSPQWNNQGVKAKLMYKLEMLKVQVGKRRLAEMVQQSAGALRASVQPNRTNQALVKANKQLVSRPNSVLCCHPGQGSRILGHRVAPLSDCHHPPPPPPPPDG